MQTMENPVRTNKIPRQIPDQSIYTQPLPGSVMGGVLPFGCIFIQLFFILNSIWSSQTYYMFGFLFLVFVILCITCSETTILLCYFHLCAEVSIIRTFTWAYTQQSNLLFGFNKQLKPHGENGYEIRILWLEGCWRRVVGRPRLICWVDGVKVDFGNKRMTVRFSRQFLKNRN